MKKIIHYYSKFFVIVVYFVLLLRKSRRKVPLFFFPQVGSMPVDRAQCGAQTRPREQDHGRDQELGAQPTVPTRHAKEGHFFKTVFSMLLQHSGLMSSTALISPNL